MGDALFHEETTVPMGEKVRFTVVNGQSTDEIPNLQYTWEFPNLSRASVSTAGSTKREFVFADDVINRHPTPWSFEFKVTPSLEGEPGGVQYTRTIKVHVYKAIWDVTAEEVGDSSPANNNSPRSALSTGSIYQFKVLWKGSEGSCNLMSQEEPTTGTK